MSLGRKRATINERGMAWLVKMQENGRAIFESPPLLSYGKIGRIEKNSKGHVGSVLNEAGL